MESFWRSGTAEDMEHSLKIPDVWIGCNNFIYTVMCLSVSRDLALGLDSLSLSPSLAISIST
jgi:hypothetical protein